MEASSYSYYYVLVVSDRWWSQRVSATDVLSRHSTWEHNNSEVTFRAFNNTVSTIASKALNTWPYKRKQNEKKFIKMRSSTWRNTRLLCRMYNTIRTGKPIKTTTFSFKFRERSGEKENIQVRNIELNKNNRKIDKYWLPLTWSQIPRPLQTRFSVVPATALINLFCPKNI